MLDTPGLVGYWRLGEASGPSLADSRGVATGSASTGPRSAWPGALAGDPNTALGFDGANDSGSVPLNLSGSSKATVEFWLNWSAYDNEDDLAMELTENFNQNSGGFIVDPNPPQGSFGVGIGIADSRNNVFFARPSAGAVAPLRLRLRQHRARRRSRSRPTSTASRSATRRRPAAPAPATSPTRRST